MIPSTNSAAEFKFHDVPSSTDEPPTENSPDANPPEVDLRDQLEEIAVKRRRTPRRVRVSQSVKFRLASRVFVIVALALFLGGFLLTRWVETTLTNDVRNRNEIILTAMVDALSRGEVPAELFARARDFSVPLDEQTRTNIFGQNLNPQDVISSTYFYIEGEGITDLEIQGVNSSGQLVFFGREGPPRQVEESAIRVTKELQTSLGTLTLHAVSPTENIERSIGALTGALWLGLPVLAMASGLMTWIVADQALVPVGIMTRRVRELTATTLDARVPVPDTRDELAELASTMNQMLDRLHYASLAQRQFVSDASHELRSPVASIRTQLETAMMFPDDVDWPEIAKIVLAEDARIEHLVGNLLAMARLEEGRHGPQSEVDLDELVLGQVPRITQVAVDARGVRGGRVWANVDELTSVVRNLLDNAVRHAQSRVAVAVYETGPWVAYVVDDDGPGVPDDERDRIFDRFARLQEGRSRDQGGSGLGLALSKRIVDHSGGRIEVADSPLGGARFIAWFPSSSWAGEEDHDDTAVDGYDSHDTNANT